MMALSISSVLRGLVSIGEERWRGIVEEWRGRNGEMDVDMSGRQEWVRVVDRKAGKMRAKEWLTMPGCGCVNAGYRHEQTERGNMLELLCDPFTFTESECGINSHYRRWYAL
jgi:hypothetical protein